ncbi:MAG TPA: antibiotic biosynthesis monooxygenase [Albitalea sp.]|jgi:heme-degrading monooxygenase HmoA|nr:antibiotic biosynthesis monooxygenase [Albitalea sp.]
MIAVIFEVTPSEGQRERYLDIAAELKPMLETIDGFISVERFQSLTTPGKMLSLSFWRDEAAVRRWRELGEHRGAQHAGRESVFDDYRLRVAQVIRDYGMFERDQAPQAYPAKER